jgi:hypothetical protein
MKTYKVKVEYSFFYIKYWRTFDVIGHETEAQVKNVLIRPRLVLSLTNGNVQVIPAIDAREYIIIGGNNGLESDIGERGEPETQG